MRAGRAQSSGAAWHRFSYLLNLQAKSEPAAATQTTSCPRPVRPNPMSQARSGVPQSPKAGLGGLGRQTGGVPCPPGLLLLLSSVAQALTASLLRFLPYCGIHWGWYFPMQGRRPAGQYAWHALTGPCQPTSRNCQKGGLHLWSLFTSAFVSSLFQTPVPPCMHAMQSAPTRLRPRTQVCWAAARESSPATMWET